MVPATAAGFRRGVGRVSEVQRRLVDDEASPPRIERRHDRADRRQVELADRAAADDVDLRLAGPIDVSDGAEQAPADAMDLGADDLMPIRLARLELGVAINRNFEVDAPETLGRGPIVDLGEPESPAGTVLDRRGRFDRQRGVAALRMEDVTNREALIGSIREDLDANEALQPVGAADPPDDDASRLAQRASLRGSRA